MFGYSTGAPPTREEQKISEALSSKSSALFANIVGNVLSQSNWVFFFWRSQRD